MDIQKTDGQAAEHAKAPRISVDDITAAIGSVYYIDGYALSKHAGFTQHYDKTMPHLSSLHTITVCMTVMKNGYVIIGKSAPVSPENFNLEFGRRLAYEDCIKQIWPLMGWALKDKLTAGYSKE